MREYDLSRLRVLIVDSNRHFATILRTMLRAFGVREIREARDAVMALEELKRSGVDIALIDLSIGDIDGLELTRLIRSAPDSQNPDMPIIMITARSERSNVEAAIAAGVDEFIVKPLSPRILYDRIVWVLENPRSQMGWRRKSGPDRRRISEDESSDRARFEEAVIVDVEDTPATG